MKVDNRVIVLLVLNVGVILFLISTFTPVLHYTISTTTRKLPVHGEIVRFNNASSRCAECGSVCSQHFDSQENGLLYPLLHKTVNCDNIMQRVAFCPFKVVRPPPREIPQNLFNDYTMNGQCAIGTNWYIDNSAPGRALRFSQTAFSRLEDRDKRGFNVNHYGDRNTLKPALRRYLYAIQNKHVAVIGTEVPWAEAILLNLGANRVTTMEYRKLFIEDSRINVITPVTFAEKFLNRTAESFDAVFSYSSIEHTGLGRYGDPLMPYGDMEAMAQIWCATKPGGYLFLAIPMFVNRSECVLRWNSHRLYGYSRMQHLTANWKVHNETNLLDHHNFLYILQKID